MATLEQLLSHGIVERLGWTLIHFIWQAGLVALLLVVVLKVLRRRSAGARYIVSCLALTLIVALPLVTMHLIDAPGPIAEVGPVAPPMPMVKPQPVEVIEVAELPLEPVEAPALEAPEVTVSVPWKQRAIGAIEPALPWLVLGWLLGVVGLSAWHLGGWAQLQRMRRRMVREVAAPVRAKLAELARHLGIRRAVGLLESALVEVPTVVGWIKPVILLPARVLTGLDSDQLEAILAHELAHVRRYDYLVNILQSVVEILGFFHPAVWWISHRIRAERENCCDDLAVAVCGDSVRYARALTCLEEMRHHQTELAVAATGGSLVARIGRLLGRPAPTDRRFAWLPGLVALLLVAATIIPSAFVLAAPDQRRSDALTSEAPMQQNGEEGAETSPRHVLLDCHCMLIFHDTVLDQSIIASLQNAPGSGAAEGRIGNWEGAAANNLFGTQMGGKALPREMAVRLPNKLHEHGCLEPISYPQFMVQDGRQAWMTLAAEEYYLVTPSAETLALRAKISEALEGMRVGLTPHVVDANSVVLEITVQQDERESKSNDLPGSDSRTIQNHTVLLKNECFAFRVAPQTGTQLPGTIHVVVAPWVVPPTEDESIPSDNAGSMERRVPHGQGSDEPSRQVLFDFVIAEVASDETLDYETAVQARNLLASVGRRDGSALPTVGELQNPLWRVLRDHVKVFNSDNAKALTDLLISRGHARLLSEPAVMTSDGISARIAIGEDFTPESFESSKESGSFCLDLRITPTIQYDPSAILCSLELDVEDLRTRQADGSLGMIGKAKAGHTITGIPSGAYVVVGGRAERQGADGRAYTLLVLARPSIVGFDNQQGLSSDTQDQRIASGPRQVFLDIRTVAMEHSDLADLGIEWAQPTTSAGPFGSSPFADADEKGGWPWGVQIGYTPDSAFTTALQAALDRLSEKGHAKLLARQQVVALDGRTARVAATTEEQLWMLPKATEGQTIEQRELVTIENGTVIQATPRLGYDDDIVLELAVEHIDSVPRDPGDRLPVVTRRTSRSSVTIRDGGTVALAGLSEQHEDTKREIIVFVTARLTPENPGIAGATPSARLSAGHADNSASADSRRGEVKRTRFSHTDAFGCIDREFGFEELGEYTAMDRRGWRGTHPYLKLYLADLTCSVAADRGTLLVDPTSGTLSPGDASFSDNVVIHISPSEDNDTEACSIYLDGLSFDAVQGVFLSSNIVRIVCGNRELVGKGLELVCERTPEQSGAGRVTAFGCVWLKQTEGDSFVVYLRNPPREPAATVPEQGRTTLEDKLSAEQMITSRRQYVYSDPIVKEFQKSIAEVEQDLIVARQTRAPGHPELIQRQELLEDFTQALAQKRAALEREFDTEVMKLIGEKRKESERRSRRPSPEQLASLRLQYVNIHPIVRKLKENIAEIERDLIVARQTLAPNNPEIIQKQELLEAFAKALDQERAALEQELDDGIKKRMEQKRGESKPASDASVPTQEDSDEPARVRVITERHDDSPSPTAEQRQILLDVEILTVSTDRTLSPEAATGLSNLWDSAVRKRKVSREDRASLPSIKELQVPPAQVLERCAVDGQADSDVLGAMIDLLKPLGYMRLVSDPEVLATDGKPMEVGVMTEEYYMLSAAGTTEKFESGIRMNVTPHLGNDDCITLDVAIETANPIPGDDSQRPSIRRHSLATAATLDNETMLVLRVRPDKGTSAEEDDILYVLIRAQALPSPPVAKTEAKTVTAMFVKARLADALREIGKQTGAKIAVDFRSTPDPITVELNGLPVEAALEIVLKDTGYAFKKEGDRYLVFRPITAMFEGTDLREALMEVGQRAGVTVVSSPGVSGEVWAELQDASVEEALNTLLAGTTFTVKVTPDYYLVAEPKEQAADRDTTSVRTLGGANDPARHGTAHHIHLDLTVMEVATQARLDRQAAGEASKWLLKDGRNNRAWRPSELRKRTVGELLESLYHDAPPESFEAFADLLVSRGYIDLLMNPTLVAVEGRQAKIGVPGKAEFAVVAKTEDNGRTVRLDANLDLNIRTPLATTNDSNVDPENAPASVKTVRSHVTLRADNQGCALQPLAGNDNSTFYLLARPEILPTKAPARVTATFNGTSLLDAIEEIGTQAGVKLAVDATVKPIPIIARIEDLTVPEALQVILEKTEYTVHYDLKEGFALIFRPITVTFHGESLDEAIKTVAALAEVDIACDLAVYREIHADLQGVPLETALDTLLKGSPYTAKIEANRSVRIVPRDEWAGILARRAEMYSSTAQEGLHIRLRAEKSLWHADEIPILRWDLMNAGAREFLHVAEGQRLAQLEVDGVWYVWPSFLRRARLADLRNGKWVLEQPVTLSPIWSKAKPEDLQWDNDLARAMDPTELRTSLQLTPGKHTIRLAVVAVPSRANTGDPIRVVSQPIAITIASRRPDQTVSWPPGRALARAFKEMAFCTTQIVMYQHRPESPEMVPWIAQALSHATETANLAKDTPLEASAAQMVEALTALQKAVERNVAEAKNEFAIVTKANTSMMSVFSRESQLNVPHLKDGVDAVQIEARFVHASDEFLKGLVEDPNTPEELAAALTLSEGERIREAALLDDTQVRFLLRAAQRDKQSRSLAAPRVTVLDGESAEVRVGQAMPRFAGFSEPNGPSGEPVAQYESIHAGLEFNVAPHLQKGSNNVYLEAKAKITSVLGNEERVHQGKYPYTFPIISTVEVQTAVTTPLGKTVLFGGARIESRGHVEPPGETTGRRLLVLMRTKKETVDKSETPPVAPPLGPPMGGGMMGGMGGGMMGGFPPGQPPLPPAEEK